MSAAPETASPEILDRAEVSEAPPSHAEHQPYIPASQNPRELTLRAVILGAVLGVIFAASSVYLALKVGLTVSASIPIAVLSITIFRAFGRATILENNIVQTTGSAGESLAAGIAFTMPAFLLMGYEMEGLKVVAVALLGGLLGVLMMIPLRHGLIVEEHKNLTYPEGTACADVLIVGETGGTNAKTVLGGFGIGFLYKLLGDPAKLFQMNPDHRFSSFRGASFGGELTPEMLGVGYIIGPRTASVMMAGGVLAYLILIPLIAFFGEGLETPIFPATTLIREMAPNEIRSRYVLYIGAGAVATGGFVSLGRAMPTIWKAFRSGVRNFRMGGKASAAAVPRTARDLPFSVVIYGSLALLVMIWLAPMLEIPLVPAILIMLFGFFFVTVSSRITGEIGSSSNPISGMTVATLLITCLLFLAMGWVGVEHRAAALTTAAIVCVAASNGGTTSQDLKTGFLVGATPRRQQIALLVGVATSALFIGWTLLFLNKAYTTVVAEGYDAPLPPAAITAETMSAPNGQQYRVGYMADSGGAVPQGKYLVDEAGKIAFLVDPGIGGRAPLVPEKLESPRPVPAGAEAKGSQLGPDRQTYQVMEVAAGGGLEKGRYLVSGDQALYKLREVQKLDAPKASLFALIIDGILTRKLPWSLVLIGVMLAVTMELCGVASLPFAVGVYLPLSTSVPIFVGGLVRWLVDWKRRRDRGGNAGAAEEEFSPGTLLSSGYIAGGAIAGLVAATVAGFGMERQFDLGAKIGEIASSNLSGIVAFGLIVVALYVVGTKAQDAVTGVEPGTK
ncbi:OPT family oligopeptide transporter [Chondromyces apiculatus]|uniref:Oligopeptide transporter, OPT family n=1 Tax=Chondromyces apiculatus DSM 436 TaxID=1192034 RepID=A0A017TG64_9BACT|nr:oligopeptide transporter, OPT family [Chondromyces apiculatus]EYF07551.1 oligopeptide transporter, OPT family [Chondromyces apiculatus DSM 436]